jgi:hypothetical protein
MSQIATVELIYVAKSGRQYRAKHKQVHLGWELEDLEQQAKSAISLRDYAIEFVNDRGHKQYIMPTDLETVIVNVVAVTEERWEEPAYEELQQKWNQQLKPYADPKPAPVQEPVSGPSPEHVRAVGTALMTRKPQPRRSPVQPVTPDGEVTQSIKISWPMQETPVPKQRVNWPDKANDETQPMKVLQGEAIAGLSMEDATQVVQRVAAGGAVTPGA